jgi:metaxin
LPSLDTADLPLRAQAYLSLITLSLRNAWLHALYLDPSHTALVEQLYIRPASSSRAVQATLLYQLRRAAAEQIATGAGGGRIVAGTAAPGGIEAVDEGAVYDAAGEALAALAGLLGESGTEWFFGGERPGGFDAALFSYTHLMMEFMGGEEGEGEGEGRAALGRMVRSAGEGQLARHRESMLEAAWPGWDRR